MPSGNWSFIHEWTLYEYMLEKYNEGTLRLKWVVKKGKLNLKNEYKRVKYLKNILNTDFPDIEQIEIEGDSKVKPAEVKFITSKFEYHRKKYSKGYTYTDFLRDKGCIIVLAHDEMPRNLHDPLDVFELDESDFISFVRENLLRLINRQIHKSTYSKIWVMYQGPNFNKESKEENVLKGRESGIWCPSTNLNGFDLGKGDKVVFIRTQGARTQELNKKYDQWKLVEIYIGEVSITITSRAHYCQLKGIKEDRLLWYDETNKSKKDPKIRKRMSSNERRWERVFAFKEEAIYQLNLYFKDMPDELYEFKKACVDAYQGNIAREINIDQYLKLFQYISKKSLEDKSDKIT